MGIFSLRLCDASLWDSGKILGVLGVLAVQLHLSFAFSAAFSLTSAATALPFAPRRPYGSHPLQRRHFSGISRASRGIKMSIQRLFPCLPPIISAGNMHNRHKTKDYNTSHCPYTIGGIQ